MDKKEFGQALKCLRKERHITQQELAEKLYVTTSAVSKWENGQNYPDIETVCKIANLFGVSVEELMETASIPETVDIHATPDTQETAIPHRRKILFFIVPSVVTAVSILVMICHLTLPRFRVTETTSAEDTLFGNVVEISVRTDGIITDELYNKQDRLILQEWKLGRYGETGVEVVKLCYYSADLATPNRVIYLFPYM
ncbi:MAG: helix-turn-helix transcriptional regulator [Lachnospiraceae bacterium]|nr:helix-turn-helix transcriptional regulator [Lachnospiraceae bacterium]